MPRFVARDEKIEKRKKQKRNLTRVAGGLIDSTKNLPSEYKLCVTFKCKMNQTAAGAG